MQRGAKIASWAALALVAGAFALLFWITEIAQGPPYTTCGVSMSGARFGIVGLTMIAAGFLIGFVAAVGPWRVSGWMCIPAIAAAVLGIPAAALYLFTLLWTFGWEC
jgi:hypothetical protein